MSRGRFLSLKVREGKEPKERTLTPHEDGFLKNFKKKEVTRMRKYLALILVALLAISFVPFRFTGTHAVYADQNEKAVYVLMALQQAEVTNDLGTTDPYPYDTGLLHDPDPTVVDPYEALRPFEFKFPKNWYDGASPVNIFATDVYFDVTSEGSLSDVGAHYYVLLVETSNGSEVYNVYIDPDTVFDAPGDGNTQLLGELDTSSTPWTFTYNSSAGIDPYGDPYPGNMYPLAYGPAAGRFFNIGFSDRENDGDLNEAGNTDFDGDLILFFEDLTASCCGHPHVYDISVESDVEPAWWLNGATPDNPKAAAVLSPGTGNDFSPRRGDLGRSTVPTVQVVTFMDIQLFASEYLDLEVFLDNGTDNIGANTLTADNNDDDYIPGIQCEEYVGAINGNGFTAFPVGVAYGWADYGSGPETYVDMDGSGTVTAGDIRLKDKALVAGNDWDVNTTLNLATASGWYDLDSNSAYDWYVDVNGSGTFDPGVDVFPGPEAFLVGAMETWNVENPVYGISMNYGDFRGLDINVLPGEMDLDVTIETESGVPVDELKVEQTFNVTVSLPEDCNYPAGTVVSVYFYLPGYVDTDGDGITETPNGYELVHGPIYLTPASPSYTWQVTGWRGNWLYAEGGYDSPEFKIEAYADTISVLGPEDYDCSYLNTWNIKYEDLSLTADKKCISHLDQRFPNIGFTLFNVDNPEDVDDPSGVIDGDNLYAWVDASGVGIEFLAMATDGNQKYLVQVNSDGTYTYWEWDDTDSDGVFDWDTPEFPSLDPSIYGTVSGTYVDDNITGGDGVINAGDHIGSLEITAYPYHVQIVDGIVRVPVLPPKSGCDEITFTVFTTEVMYNHVGPRPPLYIADSGFPGVDYLGTTSVTVTKIYDLNFAEFEVIDEGLRNSPFETTNGVLTNLWWELRSYPGGQTVLPGWGWGYDHTGSPDYGPVDAGSMVPSLAYGFNSRYADKDLLFWKLGTSYFPLTDYTIRFIAKDADGDHLSFANGRLDSIEIKGVKADPAQQPVFIWRPWREDDEDRDDPVPADGKEPLPDFGAPYDYQGYATEFGYFDGTDPIGLPVIYDDSDDILITDGTFEHPTYTYDDGWTLNDVQVITGIIPTGPGYIQIIITDEDGNTNSFKWCTSCFDTPEGIPVHAIQLTGFPESITVDKDTTLDITAKVYPNANGPSTELGDPPYGENTQVGTTPLASNVVVFVWQDIGVIDPATEARYGVGDGWITGQPTRAFQNYETPTGTINIPPFYNAKDFNGDGVISFADHETEIVGKYDTTTYTWSGGFKYLESLTFNINNGEYLFDLTSANDALVTEIGFDFDNNGILRDNELIPVTITAYQFGDDNSSGGWDAQEVYLAGQVFVPVEGVEDWNVDTEPCLTAGVVPELNGSDPLTFTVTDADGNPVDLTIGINGVTVTDSDIQDWLFRPDDDANNWVRVLLNDTVDYNVWNNDIKLTSPVVATADFSEEADGIYKFLGFTANDKGEFEVRVYSPDRKHYGKVDVVVELPDVSYEIVNVEDENGTVFTVPGDPDFTMTVGDLRFYKVTVTAKDCNGNPIGGPAVPEECQPAPEGTYAGFLPWMAYTPHYFNLIATEYDGEGRVYGYYEPREPEFGHGFTPFDVYGDTVVDGVHDLVDDGVETNNGIYNEDYNLDQWDWGQLFPNLYDDCAINVKDTIPLDENGQATFFVITNDISVLSGILGKNEYVDDDVNGDGTFYLDWYANANRTVDVDFMHFEVLNGETHEELGREIFNENYYDLTYGLENHLVVKALPADERDLPVREGVQVQLVGNVETWAYGTFWHNADGDAETTLNFLPRGVGTKIAYLAVVNHYGDDFFWNHDNDWPWWADFTSPGEPMYWTYDDRAPDFTLEFTCIENTLPKPYGHDIEDQREVQRIAPPVGNASWPLPYFDAAKGLGLSLKGDLTVGVETEITVKVLEAGPNFPVAGAEVTLYGAGVDLVGTTDADGVVKFSVKPIEAGDILITATKDGYISGKMVVSVGADTIAPELTVDKPASPTNEATVTITGTATDNSGSVTVTVNGVEAEVGADGKFSAEVTLTEGENEITVVAKDASGNKTEKTVVVVLDTVPPELTVDALPEPLTSTTVKLSGKVEEGAKVMVNDVEATVANDYWEAEVELEYGENVVTITATDAVGNETAKEITVVVYKKTVVELQIGNPMPRVNGEYGEPYEAAPYIKNGRTMVPLRLIAEAFGANVEWIPETRGINITLDLDSAKHTIGLQVGNPTAIVDGEVFALDVAPEIVNGRTFVPIRFIAEAFGADVGWDSLTRTVTITFLWY